MIRAHKHWKTIWRTLATAPNSQSMRHTAQTARTARTARKRTRPVNVPFRFQTGTVQTRERIIQPQVIYEDAYLLVVDKPCGMVSQPIDFYDLGSKQTTNPVFEKLIHSFSTGSLPLHENPVMYEKWKEKLIKSGVDILTYYKCLLKEIEQKSGNAFLSLVNRLDKPVSGVIIMGKRTKAVQRLMKEYRERKVEKEYLAVVEGELVGHGVVPAGTTSYASYWKAKSLNAKHNLVRTVGAKADEQGRGTHPDGELKWSAIHQFVVSSEQQQQKTSNSLGSDQYGIRTLVGVRCSTGGKHQIRRQLAYLGHPIVGDWLYGSVSRLTERGVNSSTRYMFSPEEKILLHASKVLIRHPMEEKESKPRREFIAPVPKNFLHGVTIDISSFHNRFYNIAEAERLAKNKQSSSR